MAKLAGRQVVATDAVASPAAVLLPRWRHRIYAVFALLALLVIVILFATSIGSVKIPFGDTAGTVFSAKAIWVVLDSLPFIDINLADKGVQLSAFDSILLNIRLPRILLAGLVGAALAVAGAAYQGLFRNPLADPYLIGVAQGAAVGAAIGFLFPIALGALSSSIIPIFAFLGAMIAVLTVYWLARVGGALPVTTLILAGVAMGALLMAIVSYLITIAGDKIHGVVFWLMGSFSVSQWSEVWVTLPVVILGGMVILVFARSLNLMQLGEEQAQQLGVNVERMKLILLAAATVVTAAAVSFVGIIGFVGIIIPHAVRLIWGPDYRFLLPLSVLVGATFLILADIIARTALAPSEIPIGIITALCGAPFFLYILRKRTKVLF